MRTAPALAFHPVTSSDIQQMPRENIQETGEVQDTTSLGYFSTISSLRNSSSRGCTRVFLPCIFFYWFELFSAFGSLASLHPHFSRNPNVMISIVEKHETGLLFVLAMLPGDCSGLFLVLVLWEQCLLIPGTSLHHSFYRLALYYLSVVSRIPLCLLNTSTVYSYEIHLLLVCF